MTSNRRWMILKIADGDPGALKALWTYSNLVQCDELLKWLINNKVTGQKFLEFLLKHKDPKSSADYIWNRIHKELGHKTIFLNGN